MSTIKRPDLAARLLSDYSQLTLPSEDTNEIARLVASLFDANTSKKNTPFDHYMVAYAKHYGIKTVFSFDKFYRGFGLKLATDLIN